MDRRSQRHLATRSEILDAAWALARERGLAGWSLRDLAHAVGMRAPSLYVYFPNKDAIFDAMFADGYGALLKMMKTTVTPSEPRALLTLLGRRFFEFSMADTARLQLMFWRVIPGFEPSPESYAVAIAASEFATGLLASIGIDDPAAFDLWLALMSGIVTQQAANDPTGSRWLDHLDVVVEMFTARFLPDGIVRTPAALSKE